MSTFEKAKERLRSLPSDYTYSEAKTILLHIGFAEIRKGRTSGSRVMFYRSQDNMKILLHKPHPGDIMSKGTTEDLYNKLKELGELT